MLPTFLAQLAAGSALAVAYSPIREVSWKYLRLMAVVCLAISMLGLALILREGLWPHNHDTRHGIILLVAGAVPIIGWIFMNAMQADAVRGSQRALAIIGGALWLAAAVFLAGSPDRLVQATEPRTATNPILAACSIVLGAGLLGSATAAMLLGHRYLTDTGMSIAPLRRLAALYLAIVVARGIWVCAAGVPIWSSSFTPNGSYVWFWLMICVRMGIGIVGTGIFAWMVWDCVKRRATQSATAIFYLSMIFIFLGELSGQYLLRSESLPM